MLVSQYVSFGKKTFIISNLFPPPQSDIYLPIYIYMQYPHKYIKPKTLRRTKSKLVVSCPRNWFVTGMLYGNYNHQHAGMNRCTECSRKIYICVCRATGLPWCKQDGTLLCSVYCRRSGDEIPGWMFIRCLANVTLLTTKKGLLCFGWSNHAIRGQLDDALFMYILYAYIFMLI